MIASEAVLGLPGYQITKIAEDAGMVRISARHDGPISCVDCGSTQLRNKDLRRRELRHESWGLRHTVIDLETRKFRCLECGRTFWQRFPGILPRKRATEPFRRIIYLQHWDGISRSRLSRRQGIGSATVERWFQDFLQRARAERSAAVCPRVLGIDEHFFSRRQGYATTFCDLRGHKIFDVVLGRSRGLLSLMRRHRHNLKPEQREKLNAYLAQFPCSLRSIASSSHFAICC